MLLHQKVEIARYNICNHRDTTMSNKVTDGAISHAEYFESLRHRASKSAILPGYLRLLDTDYIVIFFA